MTKNVDDAWLHPTKSNKRVWQQMSS